jgi:hypothetical protein
MRIQLKFSLLFLLLIQVLLPAGIVLADTGPKPGMDFEFKQELNGEQVTITSGVLYECDQPDCTDAIPLEEVGPQGFSCQADHCSATAYGFAPYHRLEIRFSDGQARQSNIFETAGFDSAYTVTVRPDDLLVEAQFSLGIFPRTGTLLLVCICGVVGLALIIGLAVFMTRRSKAT